jgi:hypothetical protein
MTPLSFLYWDKGKNMNFFEMNFIIGKEQSAKKGRMTEGTPSVLLTVWRRSFGPRLAISTSFLVYLGLVVHLCIRCRSSVQIRERFDRSFASSLFISFSGSRGGRARRAPSSRAPSSIKFRRLRLGAPKLQTAFRKPLTNSFIMNSNNNNNNMFTNKYNNNNNRTSFRLLLAIGMLFLTIIAFHAMRVEGDESFSAVTRWCLVYHVLCRRI